MAAWMCGETCAWMAYEGNATFVCCVETCKCLAFCWDLTINLVLLFAVTPVGNFSQWWLPLLSVGGGAVASLAGSEAFYRLGGAVHQLWSHGWSARRAWPNLFLSRSSVSLMPQRLCSLSHVVPSMNLSIV